LRCVGVADALWAPGWVGDAPVSLSVLTMDFFRPACVIAPLIDKATDPGLLTPDWQTVMQITDYLTDSSPEEYAAVRP